jgi:hypothetical protein
MISAVRAGRTAISSCARALTCAIAFDGESTRMRARAYPGSGVPEFKLQKLVTELSFMPSVVSQVKLVLGVSHPLLLDRVGGGSADNTRMTHRH